MEREWQKSQFRSKREFLQAIHKAASRPLDHIVFNDPWKSGGHRLKFCGPDRSVVEPLLRMWQLPYHDDPHVHIPWSPVHVDWIGVYVKEFGGHLFFRRGKPKGSWLREENVYLPPYASLEASPTFFEESFKELRKKWRRRHLKVERR